VAHLRWALSLSIRRGGRPEQCQRARRPDDRKPKPNDQPNPRVKSPARCKGTQWGVYGLIRRRGEGHPTRAPERHDLRADEVQGGCKGDDENDALTTIQATRLAHQDKHVTDRWVTPAPFDTVTYYWLTRTPGRAARSSASSSSVIGMSWRPRWARRGSRETNPKAAAERVSSSRYKCSTC
jgi:hypothetical protein